MAPRTYAAHELLRMRHAPPSRELYDHLYEKLRRDVQLSDIVRMPPDRKLPCITEETPEVLNDAVGRVPLRLTRPRQLDGTDSEWKYRGRTDSENTDLQPIPAPPSLQDQKDEGFQRFYKAVVSPTHVRVTAGGRIVPNTRGSSPTGKWSKEKTIGDGTSTVPDGRGLADHPAFPIAQPAYGQYPAMYPGFAPGVTPGMAPGMPHGPSPFPVMPWQMGFGMPGGYGIMPPHMPQLQAPKQSPRQANGSSRSDMQSDAGAVEYTTSGRVPATGQFDPTRPFVYNGQWMMPSAGPTFYPYGGPSVQGGYPASSPGAMTAAPQAKSTTSSSNVHDRKSSQPYQDSMPIASSASFTNVPSQVSGPSNPPISSIRPSDITKKQIDVLRGSLRYLDDQLQYNRHQIDERGMENQAHMVRRQIEHFQKNFEEQLSFEDSRYPKTEKTDESGGVRSSHSTLHTKSSIASLTKRVEALGLEIPVPRDDDTRWKPVKSRSSKDRGSLRLNAGFNETRSISAFTMKKSLPGRAVYDAEALRKPSGLPYNAALAPAFEPRADTGTHMSVASDRGDGASQGVSEYARLHGPTFKKAVVDRSSNSLSSLPSVKVTGSPSAPYLVGHLPRGIHPSSARDTDYLYTRELTEDEHRARHMYWGKAPPHLQRGLPKFDGKDFYPPSPGKDSSSDSVSSRYFSSDVVTTGSAETGVPRQVPKAQLDPFHCLTRSTSRVERNGPGVSTQSECLPRPEKVVPEISSAKAHRHGSLAARVGRSCDDFQKAPVQTPQSSFESSKDKSSSDDGDDDKNQILFKGRRSMGRSGTKTHNEIWQSMLKKGKSSGSAAPGTISSTTAQGVLPQYAGHATASLTPAMANTAVSPRGTALKPADAENGLTSPMAEKKGENRHPRSNAR